jgi:hypothetical protein
MVGDDFMEKIAAYDYAGFSLLNSKREYTDNSPFSNVLETAFKRSAEAIKYFENKGETSTRVLNRAFYMYLSVKKEAQRTILQKIAFSLGIELLQASFVSSIDKDFGTNDEEFDGIFRTIHESAADELEFYLNYAAAENDPRVKSFINMLADLSKEFLFDVKIWYLNHKNPPVAPKFELGQAMSANYAGKTSFN